MYSTIFRLKILISILMGVLLGGCSSEINHAPVVNLRVQPPRTQGSTRVQAGETLFTIASRNGVEAQTLALINGIKPPYTVYPGQILYFSNRVPSSNMSQKTVMVQNQRTTQIAQNRSMTVSKPFAPTKSVKKTSLSATPEKKVRQPDCRVANSIPWQWPARGPLLRRFHHEGKGKGIDIGGSMGCPVKATAKGQVVYSGNALKGYGNLIILKHNEDFLSAYAHNRELKVKEGEWVKPGQEIATMGETGVEQVKLHFEIRYKGKPVDPIQYLPKR